MSVAASAGILNFRATIPVPSELFRKKAAGYFFLFGGPNPKMPRRRVLGGVGYRDKCLAAPVNDGIWNRRALAGRWNRFWGCFRESPFSQREVGQVHVEVSRVLCPCGGNAQHQDDQTADCRPAEMSHACSIVKKQAIIVR